MTDIIKLTDDFFYKYDAIISMNTDIRNYQNHLEDLKTELKERIDEIESLHDQITHIRLKKVLSDLHKFFHYELEILNRIDETDHVVKGVKIRGQLASALHDIRLKFIQNKT